jgi:arginine repressor
MANQIERNVHDFESPERAKELAEELNVPFRLAEQICMIFGTDAEKTLKLMKKAKLKITNRQRRMLNASRNDFLLALKEIVGNDAVKAIKNIITKNQIKEIVGFLLG